MNQTQQKLGYDTFQIIGKPDFKAGQIFKAQSKKNQRLHQVIATKVSTNLKPNNHDRQTVKIALVSSLKAKPKRSKPILLFSLKSNSEGEQLLVTKSGKEYLEQIGLWQQWQLKVSENQNRKYKSDNKNKERK